MIETNKQGSFFQPNNSASEFMPSTQIPSQKTTFDSSKSIPNRRVHSLTTASGKGANISASLDMSKTASAKKES